MRIAICMIALLAAEVAVSMVVVPADSNVAVSEFFGAESVLSVLEVNSSITSEISLGSNLAVIGCDGTDWLSEVDSFEAINHSFSFSDFELLDLDAVQGNLGLKDLGV